MLKKLFCIILCVITVIFACFSAYGFTPTNFEVDAEAVVLLNLDTDDILYEKNKDSKMYPASLTKLMTALLLYESSQDLDSDKITVSKNALKLLEGTDSSTGGLKAGEVLTARQMLYVLLLSSANDGANAIAEHVSGDIDTFVSLMNSRAAELGMTGTHFANAHGLNDPDHYTTAGDMALLTKKFLSVDVLKEVCYTTKYKLPATNLSKERTYTTTNLLMLNNGQKCNAEKYKNQPYYYKYAQGVKTGYTDPAGRCLISTATKNGYTYMCVLMNSPVYDGVGNKIRIEFGDTKALYELAFNDFEYKTVLNGGDIIGEAPVDLSWDTDFVSVSPSESLSAVVPKVADTSTVSVDIHWYKESFDAPIKKGDILGECDVSYAGEKLGTVTLAATKDVERSSIMYAARGTKRFFAKLFRSIPFLIVVAVLLIVIAVFIIICVVINSPKNKKKRRRY